MHAREDVIALPRYGRRLAARLDAPCLELPGGHFVMREQVRTVGVG
jgi:pimeloyl-ACP methyl ester carboxylesterase